MKSLYTLSDPVSIPAGPPKQHDDRPATFSRRLRGNGMTTRHDSVAVKVWSRLSAALMGLKGLDGDACILMDCTCRCGTRTLDTQPLNAEKPLTMAAAAGR